MCTTKLNKPCINFCNLRLTATLTFLIMKNLKFKKVSRDQFLLLQKVRKQGKRIWDEGTLKTLP